ncbi:MAG: hypothetical protein SXA11_06605 [Cyanobacteriota bacterium]|nr:hypothetical protein [Cyanobacteriota bacterium]
MLQLNLGLIAFGAALAAHKLAQSALFSWCFALFSLAIAAIIFLQAETRKNAIARQVDIALCFVLSLFGGVLAWL